MDSDVEVVEVLGIEAEFIVVALGINSDIVEGLQRGMNLLDFGLVTILKRIDAVDAVHGFKDLEALLEIEAPGKEDEEGILACVACVDNL